MNNNDVSRKDKRRHNFESKVAKIMHNFILDKDLHYRDRLTTLQADLTTLHQGNNTNFLRKLRDLEEYRDLELIRLRYFEEYRVHRSGIEFQDDIEKTKQEHETLIKVCKEKLYDSLERKIKKLKEERLLMDIANVHSYSMDYSKNKCNKNTRSCVATNSNWDSSPNEFASTNESGTEATTYIERRSLRRRGVSSLGSSRTPINEELDQQYCFKESSDQFSNNVSQPNSDSELMQYLSDSSELYALLFCNEKNNEKKKTRSSQRISTKSAPGLQSLTHKEVTEDISLIRQLTGQPPAPFK